MIDDSEKYVRVEREIEKLFEKACEKDGWVATVAISPDGIASLFLEKFGESPITSRDEMVLVERSLTFVRHEFGVAPSVESKTMERYEEEIPNTRAPYHVTYRFNVDVRDRIAALAA